MAKLIITTGIKRLQSGDNMVSKDQGIGGLIFLVCVIIMIAYTLGLFWLGDPLGQTWSLALWLIAIPVWLAFMLILGIGAWIGWTMATTPPPKPIEEFEIEEKKEEETSEEKTKEE
jgi:type VI protein secretion system component VasK